MTETSTAMKFLGGFGVLAAVVGPTFFVSQYVNDLRNDVTSSKAEVERLKGQVDQLQVILDKTQSTISSGSPGPKGDKGDVGERGEQGPKGDRGPAGVTTDISSVQALVREAVTAEIKALALTTTSSPAPLASTTFVDASGELDLSQCLPADQIKKANVITINQGAEFCGSDGTLLAKVEQLESNSILFSAPGEGNWLLRKGRKRSFTWDNNREYFIERVSDEGGKMLATIRFADKQ